MTADKDTAFGAVPEIAASPCISPADVASPVAIVESELTRRLRISRRNIERSMIALDGIARAEAAYKEVEHEIMTHRTTTVSDD